MKNWLKRYRDDLAILLALLAAFAILAFPHFLPEPDRNVAGDIRG